MTHSEDVFNKWARRTEKKVLKGLEGYVLVMQGKLAAIIEREVNRQLTAERAALYKYVGKELAKRLSTPELKEMVAFLFEQEKGRQDPNAINVEVIDGFGAGSRAKRDVDGDKPNK
jgi:DNA primase large subunit